MTAALGLVTLLSSGAGEDDEPPANTPEPAACATMAELAPNLFAMLDDGELAAVAAVLGDEGAVTRQQLRRLLAALLELVGSLSKAELDALLALTLDERLQSLLPLVSDLVAFIAGDPADPTTFRGDVLAEGARLLRVCEGERLFSALRTVAASPELPRVVAGLGEVVALDLVQSLLSGEAGPLFTRPGFTAFVCNIVFSIVRPGFDFDEEVVGPLSGIDLLDLDQPPLSTFLADTAALLDPDKPLFPAVADLVCCDVYGRARCDDLTVDDQPLRRDPVFTWLAYDLFTSDEVPISALLGALASVSQDELLSRALEPLEPILRTLAADPDLRSALVDLLATLLEPETARAVLPEIVVFIERDGLGELLAVVRAIFRGCDPSE